MLAFAYKSLYKSFASPMKIKHAIKWNKSQKYTYFRFYFESDIKRELWELWPPSLIEKRLDSRKEHKYKYLSKTTLPLGTNSNVHYLSITV